MKPWIFYPPLKAMSGGCMVLLQIARQLEAMGRLAGVLYWDEPLERAECEGLPWVRAGSAAMAAGDTYVVPEGWPNAMVLGLRRGCRTLVYCQNWSYLFHGLEAGVHWRDLPVEFLAVSDPVAWHMEQVLGKRPQIIRPALDVELFHPPAPKPGGAAHRLHAAQEQGPGRADPAHLRGAKPQGPCTVGPHSRPGSIRCGRGLAFLSCFSGHGISEGCPLPPLEAMACGCLCVGFTGFGGWDYMRQAERDGYAPHGYGLRDVPWSGNGWWSADGDVLGAALGLERAMHLLPQGSVILEQTVRTAEAYGSDGQRREIVAALMEGGEGL